MGKAPDVEEDIDSSRFSRDWTVQAACRGIEDPNIFFPIGETEAMEKAKIKVAKEICRICVVRDECLSYAIETNQPDGIWGGKTHKERKSIRRQWLAQQRRHDGLD